MGILQRIVSAGIVASIFIILANIFNKRAIGDAWEQLQVTVVKKYLSSSSLDDHDIHNVVYEVLWHGSPVTTDNVVDWREPANRLPSTSLLIILLIPPRLPHIPILLSPGILPRKHPALVMWSVAAGAFCGFKMELKRN